MPVVYSDWITREQVRAGYPGTLFVFGDNIACRGYGGQAREMRGKPNAVGIPTKWAPSNEARAFFSDADYDAVELAIRAAVARLREHLADGGTVVVPARGIGTGLADLPRHAPRIAALIDQLLKELET